MRCFVFLLLLSTSCIAQTTESIDSLVIGINGTTFTDSITIHDEKGDAYRPGIIKGYFSGDTLRKSVVLFQNQGKSIITYYSSTAEWKEQAVYASVSYRDSTVITYGYNFKQLRKIVCPINADTFIDDSKAGFTLAMSYLDFSAQIGFALTDRKAEHYFFRARLLVAPGILPGCGTIAGALVQRFEVLSTDFPDYPCKHVLIIEPCPEFLGDHFFEAKKVYNIYVATNSLIDYFYFNPYEKENIPTFWSRKIKKEE